MSASYLGEIRMFGGNYAPEQWAFCDGQLLAITSYSALFSLFGTNFGGDGRNSFGLPAMRSRVPIGQGTGVGLSPRPIGQKAGQEYVSLTKDHMPPHTHSLNVSSNAASSHNFTNSYVLGKGDFYSDAPGALDSGSLGPDTIDSAGSGSGHSNIMPSLVVSFITCMHGLYPSRN